MTAFRFARVALPSLALSLASLALPCGAAASGLEDEFDVFPQEAGGDAGPATRRVEERRRANDGDWFRAPLQPGPEDFPSNEVHDAVVANARAATARAVYRRVESTMHATVRTAQREFERSAELREALAAEQRAYDALQDARREALREVVSNPRYQAMQDMRDALSQRIADRRDGYGAGDPAAATVAVPRLVSTDTTPRLSPRDDVVDIATVKLRVGADASAMERDALADDERVRQAKADLVAASDKVSALRDGFDRSLRENEDFRRAREDLEDARIARVTAEAYFRGASLAAREALDFSYYLHRYDYYRYNHRDYGYGYSPFRFGYPYYGASFHGYRR